MQLEQALRRIKRNELWLLILSILVAVLAIALSISLGMMGSDLNSLKSTTSSDISSLKDSVTTLESQQIVKHGFLVDW